MTGKQKSLKIASKRIIHCRCQVLRFRGSKDSEDRRQRIADRGQASGIKKLLINFSYL
jgi:hypothetical protein